MVAFWSINAFSKQQVLCPMKKKCSLNLKAADVSLDAHLCILRTYLHIVTQHVETAFA